MRGYLPVSVEEISEFLKSGSMECGPLYAPTIKFLTANNDLDEEDTGEADDQQDDMMNQTGTAAPGIGMGMPPPLPAM